MLEADRCSDLKCPRPARTKRLCDAGSRLAKRRGTECETISTKVGDIEAVKHLSKNAELVALSVFEQFAQTEVGVEERVAELIVGRELDVSPIGGVVLTQQTLQIRFPAG